MGIKELVDVERQGIYTAPDVVSKRAVSSWQARVRHPAGAAGLIAEAEPPRLSPRGCVLGSKQQRLYQSLHANVSIKLESSC